VEIMMMLLICTRNSPGKLSELYFTIFNGIESDNLVMAVPETIQPIIDRYTVHRDACLRGQDKYNETQLRQDFIDPFFHSLG